MKSQNVSFGPWHHYIWTKDDRRIFDSIVLTRIPFCVLPSMLKKDANVSFRRGLLEDMALIVLRKEDSLNPLLDNQVETTALSGRWWIGFLDFGKN